MDQIHSLVADFLEQNGYTSTREALETEYGRPLIASKLQGESLQEIIEDRVNFADLTSGLEGVELSNPDHDQTDYSLKNWTTPYPKTHTEVHGIDGLVISSSYVGDLVYLATNDFKLHTLNLSTNTVTETVNNPIGKVIIRKVLCIPNTSLIYLIGMNSIGHIYNTTTKTLDHSSKLHQKLIVDCKITNYNKKQYLVSTSRDLKVQVSLVEDSKITPITDFTLSHIPACFDLVEHDGDLVIVVGKENHTLLDVLSFEGEEFKLKYKISVNDAEFSNAGFSPRSVRIVQHENVPLVIVGTSHEPYMRLILLLLSKYSTSEGLMRNQIVKNINTLSPQDKYSQPVVYWRSDGSGVWVMGDDGIVRGVDLSTGQVAVELKAHGGKIKDLLVGDSFLVSSGVDRVVKVWSA